MTTLVIGCGYFACWFLASCSLYADFQYEASQSYNSAEKYRREDAAQAIFFGMAGPLSLFVAIFNTAFWQHGLAIPGTVPKCLKENK